MNNTKWKNHTSGQTLGRLSDQKVNFFYYIFCLCFGNKPKYIIEICIPNYAMYIMIYVLCVNHSFLKQLRPFILRIFDDTKS